MQSRKECAICGNTFIAQSKTTRYCSRVCYLEANRRRRRENKARERKGLPLKGEPPKPEPNGDFNLLPGEIILGPDKNKDDKKAYQFRVTKIYKHFFEAVRTDRGWERSFTKADYITGDVRRKAGEHEERSDRKSHL